MPDGFMNLPSKGYPALRRGRVSSSGADYFLTLCAQRPADCLSRDPFPAIGLDELQKLEAKGYWHPRCVVFMPDHIHLLATLGSNFGLSEAVRLFKGRLAPVLRKSKASWQPSFYDHRLRATEDVLPVFLYIFLNPYRANLCEPSLTWPGYYCCPEDWVWFGGMTRESCPEPEWLQ
jgi:putative transposase